MSSKEKNETANAPATDAAKRGIPLSETIENAHASGDGALERDKDTILPPKESVASDNNRSTNSGNQAY